jgi:hypothetical protein
MSPRLHVALGDPSFTDSVLSDVDRIRRTAAGRMLFRSLSEAGRSVCIEPPEPPTDPPNAWTLPRDGTEFVVMYDPADWPGPLGHLPSDVVLFGRLADVIAMVSGGSPAMGNYLAERTAIPEPPGRVTR